ncbi:hypothetical protein [Cohnella abietis]|uniref:Uncharacterized protein n=1 Tax=Cohnella abietis TaxID=2507935 RepID=A0A3T1D7W9_9BACL|nr:hypothetical protein [Cohnella abietis]BBI34181.1 hypothetical protein KCTCHS21_35800 [Cohnella abietis]
MDGLNGGKPGFGVLQAAVNGLNAWKAGFGVLQAAVNGLIGGKRV